MSIRFRNPVTVRLDGLPVLEWLGLRRYNAAKSIQRTWRKFFCKHLWQAIPDVVLDESFSAQQFYISQQWCYKCKKYQNATVACLALDKPS